MVILDSLLFKSESGAIAGCMKRLVRIVTFHVEGERDVAADLWREEKVAAMGFGRTGDLRGMSVERIRELVRRHYSTRTMDRRTITRSQDSINRAASDLVWFRDEVNPEALVLAYKCRNYIAMIGKVSSGYRYELNNRLGSFEAQNKWDYPHQVGVDWWSRPEPFHRSGFSRTVLPGLEGWVARRGTIYFKDYEDSVLEQLEDQLRAISPEH